MKEEGKEKGERREETCCLSPILMVSANAKLREIKV